MNNNTNTNNKKKTFKTNRFLHHFRKTKNILFYSLIFSGGFWYYQFLSTQKKLEKKVIEINNLKYNALKKVLISNEDFHKLNSNKNKTENQENEKKILLKKALGNDEVVFIHYFLFLYKDYFISSLNKFFEFLTTEEKNFEKVLNYIEKKLK